MKEGRTKEMTFKQWALEKGWIVRAGGSIGFFRLDKAEECRTAAREAGYKVEIFSAIKGDGFGWEVREEID